MNTLIAAGAFGYSIAELAIAIVVIAAIVALVYIALQQMKIVIPQWVIQVICILAVAFVVILGIKILVTL